MTRAATVEQPDAGAPRRRYIDPATLRIDGAVARRIPLAEAVAHRMVAVGELDDRLAVAMADPSDVTGRRIAARALGGQVRVVLASAPEIRRRQQTVYGDELMRESLSGLETRCLDASARHMLTDAQKLTAGLIALVAVAGLLISAHLFVLAAMHLVVIGYAVYIAFRTYVIYRGVKDTPEQLVTAAEIAALDDLPIYTVISPVYRETAVLPQLLEALTALDYPADLLDIKLVVEGDDTGMLEALAGMDLPAQVDIVVVPPMEPRTKPKACNYALQFARGEYVVIFDAEDLPEPDQLKKALCVFRRNDDRLGCVQAKLNFHNSEQNCLTGWFTLEYTAWFDMFLPGLVSLGLPIPLGGTSNHFPRALLRELGAWDAYNVTEDADLGMRLHRSGYHTTVVDSTTWEEANSDFVNWVKQRSRWGKGYAVSWLVHMRHPVRLFRETGWRGFAAMQLILGGTFGSSVLNLLVWTMSGIWLTTKASAIASMLPSDIYYLAMVEAVLGNFLFLYVNVHCAGRRRMFHLSRLALLSPLYWLMMGLAVVKALIQLIHKPAFWEKTAHGLSARPVVVVPLAQRSSS